MARVVGDALTLNISGGCDFDNHQLRQGYHTDHLQPVTVRPGPNGTIVLIANVAQQPLLSESDTRFNVFAKNVNFGNGTQQLIVTKTYWEPPHRLPNGRMTKPTKRQVDAYQITVVIKVPNTVINR